VRRFMRVATLLLFVSAALGAVIRLRRAVTGGPSAPSEAAIRTGSFDTWPAVPVAPGRPHQSGG
jgi:hypothetical protein